MKNKIKKIFLQIFKYLTSGALGATTDVVLFAFLIWCCSVNVLIANTIATVISTSLNFIIQKKWTFKVKSNLQTSFAKYLSVALFNYFFVSFYLLLTVESWGLDSVFMKVSSYFFITIWNYFLYKHYVYKK